MASLTSGLAGQFVISREAAHRRPHTLSTFATRLCRQRAVPRKAALFLWYARTTLASDARCFSRSIEANPVWDLRGASWISSDIRFFLELRLWARS